MSQSPSGTVSALSTLATNIGDTPDGVDSLLNKECFRMEKAHLRKKEPTKIKSSQAYKNGGKVHKHRPSSSARAAESKNKSRRLTGQSQDVMNNAQAAPVKAAEPTSSFYQGALLGSFLGATLSSAVAKIIARTLQDHSG